MRLVVTVVLLQSTPAPEAWWRDRNVKGDEVAVGSGRAYISGAQVNAWDKPRDLALHSGTTSLGSLMNEISYFVWSARGSDFDTTGGMRNTSVQHAGVTNKQHALWARWSWCKQVESAHSPRTRPHPEPGRGENRRDS